MALHVCIGGKPQAGITLYRSVFVGFHARPGGRAVEGKGPAWGPPHPAVEARPPLVPTGEAHFTAVQ